MASEITICNLALSHLGADANITRIRPPDGSQESAHCARFYPIARDALLEMHTWSFAVRTDSLVEKAESHPFWKYCYAMPFQALNVCEVLSPEDAVGYSAVFEPYETWMQNRQSPVQDFVVETDANGDEIILTNQKDAVIRYTRVVTDPNRFSNLFIDTLSHYLASMLAGPVIKGDEGIKVGENHLGIMRQLLSEAKFQDAVQRNVNPMQRVPWLTGRY